MSLNTVLQLKCVIQLGVCVQAIYSPQAERTLLVLLLRLNYMSRSLIIKYTW